MARRADCRKCMYFRPYEYLTPKEKEEARRWVEMFRTGEPVLGWCSCYKRAVTYYTGRCPGYRERVTYRQRSLVDYVKK